MQRDRQRLAGLLLADVDHAIAHLRPAHAKNIAAPLGRVEEQRERQPRLAADRVPALKGENVVFGPCVDTGGPSPQKGHVARRIFA